MQRSDWTRQDPVASTTPCTRRYQTLPPLERVWPARLHTAYDTGATVNSLLTDAPNSGLTRYSGHSSMHGSTSLLFVYK